jgi:hypothetical protein
MTQANPLGPFVAGIAIILAGLAQSGTMAVYGVGTYLLMSTIGWAVAGRRGLLTRLKQRS